MMIVDSRPTAPMLVHVARTADTACGAGTARGLALPVRLALPVG